MSKGWVKREETEEESAWKSKEISQDHTKGEFLEIKNREERKYHKTNTDWKWTQKEDEVHSATGRINKRCWSSVSKRR